MMLITQAQAPAFSGTRATLLLSTLASAALLAACGGGGGTASPSTASPTSTTPTTSTTTSVTAVAPSVTTASTSSSSGTTTSATTSSSTSSGTSTNQLIVRAKGALAGGVGPIMQVWVDGTLAGQAEVTSTSYADYAFPLSAAVRSGAAVDVVFTNDATVGTENRDLFVDSVVVNGASLKPTDSGVTLDLGSGTAAFDGANVVAGQGEIYWNAALRFKAPTSAKPSITVRAKGTMAAGLGATMVVRADGTEIGSVEVRATDFTGYSFVLPSTATPARVDVVFTNDGSSGSEDRNLYVDSVVLPNGSEMHPTDSGVTFDLGSGTAAFDGANVVAGRGDILWNGALRFATAVTSTTGITIASTSGSTSGTNSGTTTSSSGSSSTTSSSSSSSSSTSSSTTSSSTTTTTTTPTGVSITAFGAVCDGQTNNATAIANAIASAKSKGVAVLVPAGTCAYNGVIKLDGVKLYGTGDTSVLYALDWSHEAIFLYGDGAEVRQVKLSGVKTTVRQAAWETSRVVPFGAKNFVVDHVTIDGSAGGGIHFAQNASNGTISNNTIKDTLADSIHMTDGANYITVVGNHIENSGDDGIAVVSYQAYGSLVHHITARNNVILNNKWGRQMSVVGGSNVLYENNYMEGNAGLHACLYIAQESSYATYGAHDVTAQRNTMKNCGGASTGHGAIMLFSDGQEANTNITLTRNDVQQTQAGQAGIRIFSNLNQVVIVDSNRVQGASPATDISTPGVTLTPYSSGTVGYTAP